MIKINKFEVNLHLTGLFEPSGEMDEVDKQIKRSGGFRRRRVEKYSKVTWNSVRSTAAHAIQATCSTQTSVSLTETTDCEEEDTVENLEIDVLILIQMNRRLSIFLF